MDTPFRKIARLMLRRSRKGQSLIIIAFAAIALIGFVGIATDVALMFVRYSTLRRAVDAAAIAAAGQVRKGLDYNSLMAVAHQYIQVHGLNATSVKVETCETEVADYLSHAPGNGYTDHGSTFDPNNPYTTGTRAQEAIWDLTQAKDQLCKLTPQKLVRVSAQIASQTTFLSLLGFGTVTLQTSSVSQTAELDVAIVLNSSFSEALDTYYAQNAKDALGNNIYPSACYNVVPTGDVTTTGQEECNNSYALMNFKDFTNRQPNSVAEAQGGLAGTWGVGAQDGAYTTDYTTNPGLRAIPYDGAHGQGNILTAANQPCSQGGTSVCQAFDTTTLDKWNKTALAYPGSVATDHAPIIRPECWYEPKMAIGFSSDGFAAHYAEVHKKSDYAWAGCCNDPTVQSDNPSGTSTFDPWDYDPNNPSGANYGSTGKTFSPNPYWYVYDNETEGFKEAVIQTTGTNFDNSQTSAKVIAGGIYRSDSRGITGDGNYSDLICRPFKDVRDAARRFITRLNFAGGDRVVLVTFGSSAKVYSPYGQNTLPIISDMGTAITTLNMQVGVELNPSHRQQGCKTAGNGVGTTDWGNLTINQSAYFNGDQYFTNMPTDSQSISGTNYWAQAQCVDTNSGAGIAAASNALVDPRYIRREAVWVMVVLSDGYPNRTPAIGDLDVGAGQQDLSNIYITPNPNKDAFSYNNNGNDPCTAANTTNMYKYCCNASATFGQQPQYCSGVTSPDLRWGWRNNDPLLANYGQVTIASDAAATQSGPLFSFGFCPSWTYNTSAQDPDVSTTFYVAGQHPICTGNDPDARHFCMNTNGDINPIDNPVGSTYKCDPQYDAMDYARDRVDFAALSDYTKTQKGNFIAMYSIFFAHSTTTTLGEYILGVKFARYIADAGDNGIIDNPIQRWYRDSRDGRTLDATLPNHGVLPPPTGGYGMVAGMTTTSGTTLLTNPSPKGLSGQSLLPFYSATNPFWSNPATYNYDISADPCAQYDYFYYNGSGDTFLSEVSNQAAYDQRAQTSCGQYYYANGPATLRAAFQSIASRLFTRLTG